MADQAARAQDALTAAEADSRYETVNEELSDLAKARDQMHARVRAVNDSPSASGAWTDQDERTLDAQRSLVEESAAVAKQLRGRELGRVVERLVNPSPLRAPASMKE